MSKITYKIKDCCDPFAGEHLLQTGATYFMKTKTWELTDEEFNKLDMDYFETVRCIITKEHSKKLPTIEITGEEMEALLKFTRCNIECLSNDTFTKRFSQCINHKISAEDLQDNIYALKQPEIIHERT